jgi:ribosomal protein L9
MIPTFFLLFAGFISTAGAIFSFTTYRRMRQTKTQTNEETAEEIVKPVFEENIKLKKKLAEAEKLFRDIKAAKSLAPDSKPENKTIPEGQ